MLKIRLRRMGSRHRPFFRVVVSDSRRVPTAAALEELGYYDPRVSPSLFKVDLEKLDAWIAKGAQPSDTVKRLVKKARRAIEAGEPEAAVDASTAEPSAEQSAAEEVADREESADASEEDAAAQDAAEEKADQAASEDAEEAGEKKAEDADEKPSEA